MRTETFWTRVAWPVVLAGLLVGNACKNDQQAGDDFEIQGVYQRGNIALAEGHLLVAEAEFRKVLTLDPGHVAARIKLARTLYERSKTAVEPSRTAHRQEALALLRKATELEATSKIAWLELAHIAAESGMRSDAIEAYRHLLKLDPADLQSLVAMVRNVSEQGEAVQAEKLLREGMARYPKSGVLELALARLLLSQKREAEAQTLLNEVTVDAMPPGSKPGEANPSYYEAQDELGRLAARQGRLADARSIYQNLVRMNPNDFMAWEVLAAIDEQEHKPAEAELKYRRSLDIDRVHMSAWRGLGRALLAQSKRDDAVFAFRKADAFMAGNPEQALEFADELQALGDKAWARSLLERARILVADNPVLTDKISQKIGRLDQGSPDGGGEPAAGGDR